MNIEVINIVDLDDGGAVMTVDLDREALLALAKSGLIKILVEAAEQTIKNHEADIES